MNKYKADPVQTVLNNLHEDAKKDHLRIGKGMIKSIFRPLQPLDFEHAYLPISKQQGEALRSLIVQYNCKNIVEFGTSFGISTIYLADAAKKIGGNVVSTELLKSKVEIAQFNINKAGLKDVVEVREGDAMETLKGYDKTIDFLFLDGWKDLYLPLFKMLETRFHDGTLIYADNMDMSGTQLYKKYVLSKQDKYRSQMVEYGKAMLTTIAA